MKNQLIKLMSLLIFVGFNSYAVAETLDEAILRSGSVVVGHNIPEILIEGQEYQFAWMTNSYVPIKSSLQLTFLENGKSVSLEAKLEKSVVNSYNISGRQSETYFFYTDGYTIPENTTGKVRVGFYHAQDDNEPPIKMYGLLPTGVVSRPYGTAGKNFYVNVCKQNVWGGQCVNYVRNYFGGSYDTMPGLCVHHQDCAASYAYDDWNLGYGKGIIPKNNSIMVIEQSNALRYGHVAVVVSIKDNGNGTWDLFTQESNWDGDENIDCNVIYRFNSDTRQVQRHGSDNWYDVRGFIYSDAGTTQSSSFNAGTTQSSSLFKPQSIYSYDRQLISNFENTGFDEFSEQDHENY